MINAMMNTKMKLKTILVLMLALCLLVALTACGDKNKSDEEPGAETGETVETVDDTVAADDTVATEPEAPAEPAAGEYTLFGVETEGYLVSALHMGMTATLTLNEDGAGTLVVNEDTMDIASWKQNGASLTVAMGDGDTAGASLDEGVVIMDLYGDGSFRLFFAADDADTSGYELMTVDEYMEALMGAATEVIGDASGEIDAAGGGDDGETDESAVVDGDSAVEDNNTNELPIG